MCELQGYPLHRTAIYHNNLQLIQHHGIIQIENGNRVRAKDHLVPKNVYDMSNCEKEYEDEDESLVEVVVDRSVKHSLDREW